MAGICSAHWWYEKDCPRCNALPDDIFGKVEWQEAKQRALADGTKGIQGYLPNNFNPTIISGNFTDAIEQILKFSGIPSTGNLNPTPAAATK